MSKEGNFLVFCMECYRHAKRMSGKEVAMLFAKYGLYDYITEGFESLHTTGVKYIVADIDEYIANHLA